MKIASNSYDIAIGKNGDLLAAAWTKSLNCQLIIKYSV